MSRLRSASCGRAVVAKRVTGPRSRWIGGSCCMCGAGCPKQNTFLNWRGDQRNPLKDQVRTVEDKSRRPRASVQFRLASRHLNTPWLGCAYFPRAFAQIAHYPNNYQNYLCAKSDLSTPRCEQGQGRNGEEVGVTGLCMRENKVFLAHFLLLGLFWPADASGPTGHECTPAS